MTAILVGEEMTTDDKAEAACSFRLFNGLGFDHTPAAKGHCEDRNFNSETVSTVFANVSSTVVS